MPTLEPITRIETYLAKIAGANVTTPEPITRIEQFLDDWANGGGGGDASPIVGTGKVGYMVVGAGTSYTVAISLTNPRYPEDFASCIIYGLNGSSYADKGAQIGQIASPNGNATVTVSSSGIVVEFTGQEGAPHIPANACTITGDITMLPDYSNFVMFTVSSDGSITIDGVNYDF